MGDHPRNAAAAFAGRGIAKEHELLLSLIRGGVLQLGARPSKSPERRAFFFCGGRRVLPTRVYLPHGGIAALLIPADIGSRDSADPGQPSDSERRTFCLR